MSGVEVSSVRLCNTGQSCSCDTKVQHLYPGHVQCLFLAPESCLFWEFAPRLRFFSISHYCRNRDEHTWQLDSEFLLKKTQNTPLKDPVLHRRSTFSLKMRLKSKFFYFSFNTINKWINYKLRNDNVERQIHLKTWTRKVHFKNTQS